MSDRHKPFIAYRTGRWGLSIMPRTAAGWGALLIWMLALVPITVLFMWFAAGEPPGMRLWTGLAAFIAAVAIWGFAMTRWILARSETIDIDEPLALKRDWDRRSGRRQRP